jgi:hypothetical protein
MVSGVGDSACHFAAPRRIASLTGLGIVLPVLSLLFVE